MSSTICSEKIHRPPCSLEANNQSNRKIRALSAAWQTRGGKRKIWLPTKKKNGSDLKMCITFNWQFCCVFFFQISMYHFCIWNMPGVLCSCQALAGHKGAPGQHRRKKPTFCIIDRINQHLWCAWWSDEAGVGLLETTCARKKMSQLSYRLIH